MLIEFSLQVWRRLTNVLKTDLSVSSSAARESDTEKLQATTEVEAF